MLIETERFLSKVPLFGRLIEMKSEKIFKWILFASRIIPLRKLKKKHDGILLPLPEENTFLGKRVLTGDGLVDLGPRDILELADKLDDAYSREKENRHRFKMVNKRETVTHNSYFQNTPSCIKGKRNTNYLYINPEDARQLNLKEMDFARISSEKGEIVLPVRITGEMMPKSVAVPWGWGASGSLGPVDGKKLRRGKCQRPYPLRSGSG